MKDWLDSIEAHTKAQAKYDKKNTVGFYMKLNIHTDLDIIRWLWSQPSKQGAIKRLIREDIVQRAAANTSKDGSSDQNGTTVHSVDPKGEPAARK